METFRYWLTEVVPEKIVVKTGIVIVVVLSVLFS